MRSSPQWLVTLAILVLAAPSVASQVGSFADLTWTFVDPGNASGTLTDDEMQVIGPDGAGAGFCSHGTAAYYETVAPFAGQVRVILDWTSFDLCHYDWPVYVLDDVPTVIPTEGGSLGCFPPKVLEVTFQVEAGQAFGLGVGTADCFEGPGVATWTGLSLQPMSWFDLGGALDPRLEYEVIETTPDVEFGRSLVVVGDTDGDGVSEYAVAAPFHLLSSEVSLHRGSNGDTLWTVPGESSAGLSFAAPGDVDADGDPDVAVGTYADSKVEMLSGVDGSVLWTWTWSGSSLDYYAGSLATHADIDLDGIPEIAVGSNTTPALPVRVLSGAGGTLLRTIDPGPGDDRFGGALADLGDIDGDGVSDLGVRASVSPPSVRVFSGTDAALLLQIDSADGLPVSSFNGSKLLGLDDVNGDAVRDIAVGAPLGNLVFNDFTGIVATYSGATGDQLMEREGPGAGSYFGGSLTAVDVDGDGVPELAAGAYGYESVLGEFDDNGLVWILDALDGTPLLEIEGPPGGGSLGSSLGTLTGAAQPTLLVGVPDHPEGARVQVIADLQHAHGAPHLIVHGALIGGSPWNVRITGGAPSLPVGLALGMSQIDLPVFGGTLVPEPTLVFWAQLDPQGRLILTGTWQPCIELSPPLYLQAWIPDPAGPEGWSATQGRRSH